jgi:hypothetical protein
MSKFKVTKWLEIADRPRCHIEGCGRPQQYKGSGRRDGSMMFRKTCSLHHSNAIAKKHGVKSLIHVIAKNAGFDSVQDYQDSLAKGKGFDSATQYRNSKHPYLKHRKSYCENIDGRFGFKCTTTIMIDAMLQVDHIDGNPSNNDIHNLQTLCACCHVYKTITNKDYQSPGRKSLKEKRVFECFA